MRKIFISFLVLLSIAFMVLAGIGCDSKKEGGKALVESVEGGKVIEDEIFLTVPNSVSYCNLSTKIKVSKNSNWKLYYDLTGFMEITTKTAVGTNGELEKGVNVFYIVVTTNDQKTTNVYKLNLTRSYAINVKYVVDDVVVCVDTAYAGYDYIPTYNFDKAGCDFECWRLEGVRYDETFLSYLDESFNINSIELKADYSYRNDINYKVEYYFQSLDGNDFLLNEELTQYNTGTTDSTIYAEIKEIDNYYSIESSVSGKINGDGSTILKVYYKPILKVVNNTVIGINKENVRDLIIPSRIGSVEITAIGESAFFHCYQLTSISIPNSVTRIGKMAFSSCYSLQEISIGSGVELIGENAFFNCSLLKTIINYSKLQFVKGDSGYGYIAYYADNVYNYNS